MTVEHKNRIFIGGISDRVQKEDIEKEFGRYGKLNHVWVAQNPPGFAFVEYDHISEADLAVSEMNGKMLLGSSNKIRVEHSHGGSRSRMRRGSGGFRGGPDRGFRSDRMDRDRYGQGSGGYRNNDGFNRRREGYGGSGGGYQNGDRRYFPLNSGRFGGGSGGPPRYRSSNGDRRDGGSYGMRRSRSPMSGRSSGKYGGRMDSNFAPVPGTFMQNTSPY